MELTLDQLSLTMPHMLHKPSFYDEPLLEACSRHDYEGVELALSKGANPNALNERGESALQLVIEGYPETDCENDDELEKLYVESAIKLIDLLLNAGAYIDMFGYNGLQPLTAAVYKPVDITRHLLEKGSNPNFNSFLSEGHLTEYDRNVSCSVLSNIATKEAFECLEEFLTPEMLEIKDLVIKYGGKHFRDDAVWTEDEEGCESDDDI